MESSSGQAFEAIQSRLKTLLAENPPQDADWPVWQARVLREARESLDPLLERLAELQQQNAALERANQALADENSRLRARMAGRSEEVLRTDAAQERADAQERIEEFRSLAEDSPDLIARFDRELRHVYVNPALIQLSGLPREAFIGRTVREVDVYQPLEALWPLWKDPLFQGIEMRLEVELLLSGESHWFDLRMVPEFDLQGEVETALVVARDITHYKAVEISNERQTELLEAIFETDPSGFAVITGPDGIIRMANASYRAAVPHPEQALIGSRMDAIWPEAEGFQGLRLIQSVLEDQASITLERLRWRYPDGVERAFTLHARPLTWENQPGALLVLWETTELENALAAAQAAAEEARRRAQDAEESHRLLEALMDHIPEGITIFSAEDLHVRYLSKYIAGLGGYQRSDLEKQPFDQYVHFWRLHHAGDQRRLALTGYPSVRAIKSGEIIQDEDFILETPDGRQVNLLINAAPIRDAEGRIFATVVAARDITERKRVEADQQFLSRLGRDIVGARTSHEVLETISRSLGEFMGVDRCFISLEDLAARKRVICQDYASGLDSAAGSYALDRRLPRVFERLSQGRDVVVGDLQHDPLTARDCKRLFAPMQVLALAAVPMFDRDGRWIETMTVASRTPRAWREEEIGLLRAVADLSHLGLESARLFENLQEFRSRFDIALRNAPITVFTTDRDLRTTWVYNPRRGYTEARLLGQTPQTLGLDKATEALLAMERGVLESGQGMRRELRIPIRDEMTSHDVTVEPLRDAQGAVTGLTVAILENTELRRMEAEALRSQTRIEIQRRLIAEREVERTRIARDLHDGPLQDMIAATYALVEAMTINEKKTRVDKMHAIEHMLQKQVQQLRRFCNDLRPPVLAPFGLEKTIRSHVEGLQALYPEMQIALDLEHDGQRLPEEIRMTLFRIYQELMNNVMRHARASTVAVHFHMTANQAELSMEDNGVGFAAPASWLEYARKGHLGLMGVQERAQMAGGKMEIHSMPGQGTRVTVKLPVW